MAADSLARQIERAYRRIRDLEASSDGSEEQQLARTQALGELYVLLDELQATQQELRNQNLELIQAQKELQGERRRYQELFELAPDGYLVTDLDGIIQEANRAAIEMFAHSAEHLVGKPLALCVAREDRSRFRSQLNHVRRSGDSGHRARVAFQLSRQDGDTFPASLSIVAVRDEQAHPVGLRWAIRDGTALEEAGAERETLLALARARRQQAEEARGRLEVESGILNAIMEHTDVHLAYLDPQFNFLRVNAAYARGSGYSVEHLIGKNHFELFPHLENQAIFERVRDTGEPAFFRARPFEFADRPELGVTYWDWSLIPVYDDAGDLQGLVFSLANVTDREQARLERETHLSRMEALVSASEQVLSQTTPEDVVRRAADAARQLTAAKMAFAGYGYQGGAFPIAAVALEGALASLAEGGVVIGPGGAHLDFMERSSPVRLAESEVPQDYDGRALPEGHPQLRGLVGARLSGRGDKAAGLIMASDKAEDDFSAEDAALLVQLATVTSLALQHIEATVEAQTQAGERQAAFEAMAEGVIVYSADDVAVEANQTAREMLGLDPVGHHRAEIARSVVVRDLDPRRHLAAEELPSGRALRGERVIDERVVFSNLQGRDFVVQVSAAAIPAGDGGGGVVVVLHDVTEQERAQEQLRQYAHRLRVLNQMDRAVLAATSVEEIAQVGLRHVAELVPCLRADVILFDPDAQEMRFLAVQAPEHTAVHQGWRGRLRWAWFAESLRLGQPDITEDITTLSPTPLVSALRDDGVRTCVALPLTAGERLIGALKLGFPAPVDLTPEQMFVLREMADELAVGIQQERLHQEVRRHALRLEDEVAVRTHQLRTSEARFRTIFQGAGVGMALADTGGRILAANPALQEMVGRSADELLGKPLADLAHPDGVNEVRERLRFLVRDRDQRHHRFDLRLLGPGSTTVWADVVLSAVGGAQDDTPHIIAMVEDTSERHTAQAALIQAEKLSATGKLAASFAHEINNPLQSVIGCLGLARETATQDERTARYLSVAYDELQRAARIVARLRDLNRSVSDEERTPTEITPILETVMDLTRSRCESRGVELVWQREEDLPLLLIAPDRMQQVFLNLVLNAVDAMPYGGRLTLSACLGPEQEGVEVTVADTGVGIDAQDLPHLFDAFYTTKEGGVGLGLFVTRGIIEDHGGRIEVESEVDRGTTFTVWLPSLPDAR